jgi:hypothetical protein
MPCGAGFQPVGVRYGEIDLAPTKPHRLEACATRFVHFPAKNGFVARSLPIVVASPWPG